MDRHTEEAYRYVRSQMAPILDTLGIYRDEAYEAMEETINEDRRQNFHCQERLEWIKLYYDQLRIEYDRQNVK